MTIYLALYTMGSILLLSYLLDRLDAERQGRESIMATVTDIQNAVNELQTSISTLATRVQNVETELAAARGNALDPAVGDNIVTVLNTAKQQVDSLATS